MHRGREDPRADPFPTRSRESPETSRSEASGDPGTREPHRVTGHDRTQLLLCLAFFVATVFGTVPLSAAPGLITVGIAPGGIGW